jgi:lipopolysaccharide export system protein LptA
MTSRKTPGRARPWQVGLAAALLLIAPLPALAQANAAKGKAAAAAPPASTRENGSAFGNLGSNKEPIKIDSDRLDIFDKEGRAVFAGNVVAVQGESTMHCTSMNVFYEQGRGRNGAPARGGEGGLGGDNNSIKKIECRGPVTVASKTQVATGDNAEFDRIRNKVLLLGNVALSDGPNVTRGERIVYDLNTGTANVETNPGGRVRALFVPGGNKDAAEAKKP